MYQLDQRADKSFVTIPDLIQFFMSIRGATEGWVI